MDIQTPIILSGFVEAATGAVLEEEENIGWW